eukprot:3432511-Prymnesium_polylepis.1
MGRPYWRAQLGRRPPPSPLVFSSSSSLLRPGRVGAVLGRCPAGVPRLLFAENSVLPKTTSA